MEMIKMPSKYVKVSKEEMYEIDGGGDWVRYNWGCAKNVGYDELPEEIRYWQRIASRAEISGVALSAITAGGYSAAAAISAYQLENLVDDLSYSYNKGHGCTISFTASGFSVDQWS